MRKDCTKETDIEACHQCCDYNADKVDYPQCKKMRDKEKARQCREKAKNDRWRCYKECPKLIIYEALEGPQ